MLTPKEICDAGLAVSMAQARRMIALGAVREICGKCGACRCSDCQEKSATCNHCGAKEIAIDKKGKK